MHLAKIISLLNIHVPCTNIFIIAVKPNSLHKKRKRAARPHLNHFEFLNRTWLHRHVCLDMSQREWPCKKCPFVAPSRSIMHGYTTHDNEVVIPCEELEGESVTLKRVSGVFTCEVCGNSMKSSRSVLDFHTKCYFPDHPNMIPVATSTAGADAAGEKHSAACTSATTVFIGPSESTTTASDHDLPRTSTEGVVEEALLDRHSISCLNTG